MDDYSTTMQKTVSFLELDVNYPFKPVTSNPAAMPRSRRLQRWLHTRSPVRETLVRPIPFRLRRSIQTRLLQANARPILYPKLDPDMEGALRIRFAPEVHQLEQMIDRDLSTWLPK